MGLTPGNIQNNNSALIISSSWTSSFSDFNFAEDLMASRKRVTTTKIEVRTLELVQVIKGIEPNLIIFMR